MSRLGDIYAALAARSVSYTYDGSTVTPTVHQPHQLKASYDPSELPVRLLLPQVQYGAQGRNIQPVAFSGGSSVDAPWYLVDRLLLLPAGEGLGGVAAVAGPIIEYMDAYLQAIYEDVTLIRKAAVENVDIYTALMDWPLNSNSLYWGVEATLTVRDHRAYTR